MGTVVGSIALLATTALPPRCLFASPGAFDPGDSEADRSRILAATAEKIERCAAAERFGQSILAHLGGILLNGTAAVYLWRHDHLPLGALYQLTSGLVVGEIRIWTQPTVARDAASAGLTRPTPGATLGLWPVVGAGFAGVGGGGVF